jgi:hypothetical protein
MKILITIIILIIFNFSFSQSLYIGTGYFYEHYRQVGNKSNYHANNEMYYWAFLGGSIGYNFNRNGKWIKQLNVFANFYPVMQGDDLREYPNESFYIISQDLIAPEIGIISYWTAFKKKKHQFDLGTGLSSRFVILPSNRFSFWIQLT